MLTRISLALVALACACACATPALAAESAVSAQLTKQAESLGSLLPAGGSGTNPTQIIGQVKRVAFGSKGATVTLEGGKQIQLDFTGLSGVSGGPNYLGWAMVLFGMSVATRLLSRITRLLRPFPRRRRRRDWYDDEY